MPLPPEANQSGLNDNTGTTLPGCVSSVGGFLTSLPSEAGSALHKLVNTPMITPSACAMSVMFCGATAMLSALGGNATDSGAGSDVNLASPDQTNHILNGDATGGGHLWPGGPGKSAFPDSWSASKIMNVVSDIATDPTIAETVQANGRIVKSGTVDGINIRVVIELPSKGGYCDRVFNERSEESKLTFNKSHLDALDRLLQESLAAVEANLSEQDRSDVREYIDHGEYGVAYELLTFVLNRRKVAHPAALTEAGKKNGGGVN